MACVTPPRTSFSSIGADNQLVPPPSSSSSSPRCPPPFILPSSASCMLPSEGSTPPLVFNNLWRQSTSHHSHHRHHSDPCTLAEDSEVGWCTKEMHPVDKLARLVEAEGIKQLLVMTKKKDLLKMCEHAQLDTSDITNNKRELIALLFQRWTEVGTKKFLKKHISDHYLFLIAKTMGLLSSTPSSSTSLYCGGLGAGGWCVVGSGSGGGGAVGAEVASIQNLYTSFVSHNNRFQQPSDRRFCEEEVVRQLNMIGLEIFSKIVITDEARRCDILNQASKTKEQQQQQQQAKKKKRM